MTRQQNVMPAKRNLVNAWNQLAHKDNWRGYYAAVPDCAQAERCGNACIRAGSPSPRQDRDAGVGRNEGRGDEAAHRAGGAEVEPLTWRQAALASLIRIYQRAFVFIA